MSRRFTFPQMRVTLFIYWVSLLLTVQNSVANKNVAFHDTSQANSKIASISDALFPVSIFRYVSATAHFYTPI